MRRKNKADIGDKFDHAAIFREELAIHVFQPAVGPGGFDQNTDPDFDTCPD